MIFKKNLAKSLVCNDTTYKHLAPMEPTSIRISMFIIRIIYPNIGLIIRSLTHIFGVCNSVQIPFTYKHLAPMEPTSIRISMFITRIIYPNVGLMIRSLTHIFGVCNSIGLSNIEHIRICHDFQEKSRQIPRLQ